jgi:hypothetical protein
MVRLVALERVDNLFHKINAHDHILKAFRIVLERFVRMHVCQTP